MKTLTRLAAGLFAIFIGPGSANADRQLIELAKSVPLTAKGEVFLVDIAAASRQLASLPIAEEEYRPIMPYTYVQRVPGFSISGLPLHLDGYVNALGFTIGDIGQIAGWDHPPKAPIVMLSQVFEHSSADIGAALLARGYKLKATERGLAWHRLDDGAMDREVILDDPFTGDLGLSTRIALEGDRMFVARTWDTLATIRTEGPSFLDRPFIAQILDAAYQIKEFGDPIDATFLGPQLELVDLPQRMLGQSATPETLSAMREILGISDKTMPGFAEHAIVLLQDGTRLTGALLIPYPDKRTAELARNAFAHRVATMSSFLTDRSFDQLLPQDRAVRIVEGDTGVMLVLAFTQEIDPGPGISMITLLSNPRKLISDMYLMLDLHVITGRGR